MLKQRLESIGLDANRNKELHIIAHSMVGLVSRWFIEREGSNQIVRHLIMLGTLNNGSPWSKVEDWAVTMLGAGLNDLTAITWSIPILGMLTKAIAVTTSALEVIDVSLDQMQPGSEFLNNLAASADPGIPSPARICQTWRSPDAVFCRTRYRIKWRRWFRRILNSPEYRTG